MSLDNETGLDPQGIRVRPVTGLVAADYFAPGYFVWAVLIANLARIGYEEKTMYMAAYDWRISFQNTEVSQFLKLVNVFLILLKFSFIDLFQTICSCLYLFHLLFSIPSSLKCLHFF